MSEELEKLRHKQYPKISDFGAVDDVGKRPISLWHKQTPGIPGVDFYADRLYNPKSRSKRSRYSSENDVLIEKSVKYTDFFLLSIVYV